MSRMTDLLALSYVNRWAITPMFRSQSVAEHSYRVAIIALAIFGRLHGEHNDSYNWPQVIHWALIHDAPESYSGDIPKPFKDEIGKNVLRQYEWKLCPWYQKEALDVHPTVKAIVGLADTIEAAGWVQQHGNGAKWRFGPNPERPMYEVLRERINNDANYWELRGMIGIVKAVQDTIAEIMT